MSKNEFAKNYFCVCNQAYKKKSQIRKHVSVCKYVQNQNSQYAIFSSKKDLLQLAISNYEIQSVTNNQSMYMNNSVNRFKCGCQKRFKSKGGYYRHIKKCKLRPEQQIVTGRTKCNEPGCLLTFKYIRDLRQHLIEKHKIQFNVEDKMFNRYSDFLCWKENYETETCSCFYHRKTETRCGRKVEYWYCNRSGIYQSASHGRRRKLKSQGILKINNNCTSSITLTINEIEGTVQAIIYHTHYGHDAELVHLRIPKSDKQEIASKLLQGVKIEDILLSYKKDESNKQIERKHLIKRRDILNISKKYHVNIILPKIQPSKKKPNFEFIQEPTESFLNKDWSPNDIESKKRHSIASQLPLSFVNFVYENIWKISMKNNVVSTYSSNNYNEDVYQVTKNHVVCDTDNCNPHCNCCSICYHSYSCTCPDYLSKNIICEHIHLVVLFQVTSSQLLQYEHGLEKPIYKTQDHTTYTRSFTDDSLGIEQHIESVGLIENVSENDNYKTNTRNIKLENLKNLKIRLEKLMLETLQKVNECNNCDLLENIEKQLTNIEYNLSTNQLQGNKTNND